MEMMNARKRAIRERLSECLDSYALIGFDPDGNLIDLCVMPTDLHVLACQKAFKDWYKEQYETEPVECEWEWEGDDDGEG